MVNPELLEDLCYDAGETRKKKAMEYVAKKRVNITKVIYEDNKNFEIKAKVRGNQDNYNVYIKVQSDELEDLKCDCMDYQKNYAACKHIVATMVEFNDNSEYVKIFTGEEEKSNSNNIEKIKNKKNQKNNDYKLFKQLVNEFYYDNNEDVENSVLNSKNKNIKIIPKLIIDKYNFNIKLEFRIGENQLYKLKSLPEFYENMLYKQNHKYGLKLEFVHDKKFFDNDSLDILAYIMKYAEIIKYANQSAEDYGYYGRRLSDSYITVSNSGFDELFEIYKNKNIEIQRDYAEYEVCFVDEEPEIKFEVEEVNSEECRILTNIDIYEYNIIRGKDYVYFEYKNKIYKCSKQFENTVLKFLDLYRKNFTNEIKLKKEELNILFSVVFPKIRNNMEYNKLDMQEVEKYIPKELFVKIYLDYDTNNYITADIKFCYGDFEFNPLENKNVDIARDLIRESNVLDIFVKTGFLFDKDNSRLILTKDEDIYNFLSNDIEKYMKSFEVLVTDEFRKKEIKETNISNVGVKVENNLLEINFSGLEFDLSELKVIMDKYKLKKKFHRLKNGSFINLETNDTLKLFEELKTNLDIDFKKINEGEIQLPVYRTLYLDRLLKNFKINNVSKDDNYKKIIDEIDDMNLDAKIQIPNVLNAELRNYQEVGFRWLKTLDLYKFGGILADDMGLGKTLQLVCLLLHYVVNTEKEDLKTSMVVCPSSLVLNWYNEIKKFAPMLNVLLITGNAQERKKQIEEIEQYNVIICSYDILKRDVEVYKEKKYEFKYIIADEAQYIKNNNTQNFKAIKEIISETRYALTGTPIENSLSELWSIFDFVMPGYLFSYKKFKELYENPIVKGEDTEAMKKLKMLIEPFILRRIKEEVLTELPDKTITVLNNEMEEEQKKIYMSYMAQVKEEIETEILVNGFEKSQIKILSLLMRLRQICCHPSLFIENYKGESSKLIQCIQIVKDAIESGHRILLFSGYTSMFDIIEKELEKENIKYYKLTGQTKVGERIKLVDEFNENTDIKVFLISLKAGGTGLNLIGADMVIHYDPWWNLSAENQATDRTYRIGQKKNVQVYKLITKNSIEEKIYDLQQRKAALIDNMLSTKETFINKLSKEEIMNLFKI
ncbi:MAG: DEAD/DEAH box helicase [Clostridiales bacterium]|nr:DEAD/DEAH box helicase [Clostridiales bacterium]